MSAKFYVACMAFALQSEDYSYTRGFLSSLSSPKIEPVILDHSIPLSSIPVAGENITKLVAIGSSSVVSSEQTLSFPDSR